MDGRGLLQVFLVSFPQGPDCLPYVLLITGYVVAFVTVDYPTLLVHGALVFRFHKYLFDSCVSLEVYFDSILTTDVHETFGCALYIRNNHLTYCVDWSWVCISCLERLGSPLNLLHARDWGLQLLPMNKEFPVSASHQLMLIMSLPFVHTNQGINLHNGKQSNFKPKYW